MNTIDYDIINRCHRCGVDLNEENCRPLPSGESITGMSHLCIECEQETFNRLARSEGHSLALFHCCALFNVPCKPIVLDGIELDNEESGWIKYLERLSEEKQDSDRNGLLSFDDGETYILRLFGKHFTEQDFAQYIAHERIAVAEAKKRRAIEESKLPGTSRQRDKWGTEPIYIGIPCSTEIYNELDRQYANRAADFKGQTLTAQQEDTLNKVARLNVIYDHLLRTGKLSSATATQKTIDLLLGNEQMRKKDEKPTEAYSIDAQVVALERAGCIESGKLLPTRKLQETLISGFVKKKKYQYTLDVADEIIERIYNTMRLNADQYVLAELPAELKVEDTWGEMAQDKDEKETKAEKYCGVTKVAFADKKEEE